MDTNPGDGEPAVAVYTLPGCHPCHWACRLLRRRGVEFEEVSVLSLRGGRRELLTLTGGATVPQVVIHGEPVGGTDSLARLDRAGVLVPRARGEEFPVALVRRRFSLRRLLAWLPSLLGGGGCGPWRYAVELVDREGRRLERCDAASAGEAEAIAASLADTRAAA